MRVVFAVLLLAVSLNAQEPRTCPAVSEFVLVNADTGEDFGPIEEGAVIQFDDTLTKSLNIRADLDCETADTTVDLELRNLSNYLRRPHFRVDRHPPFTLCSTWRMGRGEDRPLVYGTCIELQRRGEYEVSAVPYAGRDVGTRASVRFSLTGDVPRERSPRRARPQPPPPPLPPPPALPRPQWSARCVGFVKPGTVVIEPTDECPSEWHSACQDFLEAVWITDIYDPEPSRLDGRGFVVDVGEDTVSCEISWGTP